MITSTGHTISIETVLEYCILMGRRADVRTGKIKYPFGKPPSQKLQRELLTAENVRLKAELARLIEERGGVAA